MRKILITLFTISISFIFAQRPATFVAADQPKAPDYSLAKNWSALPFREDVGDFKPKKETPVSDSVKLVDVFYIYPTIFTQDNAKTWTADIEDEKLNKAIDNKPVKYQATAFNQTARIYAPRYRQVHIDAYDDTTQLKTEVFDFAYQDVKRAFEYYLENYNDGRPIIIASHSQGTTHSRRLIKEFFDTPETKAKLVCAYVVGFAIYPDEYEVLTPCQNPEETNCYVTWSSFEEGFEYPGVDNDFLVGKVCVNPISWTMDTLKVESKTSIFINIKAGKKYKVEARIKDDMLWVKSKIPFVGGINIKHFIDYNLFWYNIRENVALRTKNYLENNKK